MQKYACVGMQVLMGPQPNVMHYSPRPKVGKQVFHPCPIIPMHIITTFTASWKYSKWSKPSGANPTTVAGTRIPLERV